MQASAIRPLPTPDPVDFRVPPMQMTQITQIAPPMSRGIRRPTRSRINMEAVTLKICTMLATSAETCGLDLDLLDTQGSNERIFQAGELEEVCRVAEHDGNTQGDLPEEWEARYDESPLNRSAVTE